MKRASIHVMAREAEEINLSFDFNRREYQSDTTHVRAKKHRFMKLLAKTIVKDIRLQKAKKAEDEFPSVDMLVSHIATNLAVPIRQSVQIASLKRSVSNLMDDAPVKNLSVQVGNSMTPNVNINHVSHKPFTADGESASAGLDKS